MKADELTPSQEAFCREIVKGETQYQAYLNAFPRSRNSPRKDVDVRASILMARTKIKQRIVLLENDANKAIVFDRASKMKMLERIAKKNEAENAKLSIDAIKVLNEMSGDNAPQVVDNRVSVAASFDRARLIQIARLDLKK